MSKRWNAGMQSVNQFGSGHELTRRRQGQRSVWYRPTTVRHQHQQGP
jgi:hypothetical protein